MQMVAEGRNLEANEIMYALATMPLPSASEIAVFRAFPLPPALPSVESSNCLKILDHYDDKILCGKPDI